MNVIKVIKAYLEFRDYGILFLQASRYPIREDRIKWAHEYCRSKGSRNLRMNMDSAEFLTSVFDFIGLSLDAINVFKQNDYVYLKKTLTEVTTIQSELLRVIKILESERNVIEISGYTGNLSHSRLRALTSAMGCNNKLSKLLADIKICQNSLV